MNFVALTVIADFDNYVFESMTNEFMKKMLEEEVVEENFVIRFTTSKRCGEKELSNEPYHDGKLRPLRITFLSRSALNKVLFIIYKLMQIFYVSIYFYFMPFVTLFGSFLIPNLAQIQNW